MAVTSLVPSLTPYVSAFAAPLLPSAAEKNDLAAPASQRGAPARKLEGRGVTSPSAAETAAEPLRSLALGLAEARTAADRACDSARRRGPGCAAACQQDLDLAAQLTYRALSQREGVPRLPLQASGADSAPGAAASAGAQWPDANAPPDVGSDLLAFAEQLRSRLREAERQTLEYLALIVGKTPAAEAVRQEEPALDTARSLDSTCLDSVRLTQSPGRPSFQRPTNVPPLPLASAVSSDHLKEKRDCSGCITH
eukprot:TRINITY_DN69141_c0_g1_i1.p1 TRINITY_DN69141_c0_g1~~TRINITY_DN69141_c0_g1_i1.p1  ORF type:complete len:253 (-),score=53.27 TRINITY_DN69141_c0_g1_i1:8-766(-)